MDIDDCALLKPPGRWLWIAAVLTALSGCATYTEQPLVPTEELQLLSSRVEDDITVERTGPWLDSWFPLEPQVVIDDGLTIGEANALALFYAPAIREARANASIAGARVLQAGLLPNPQFFMGPMITTEVQDLLFPAQLMWELPIWGEQSAESDLAVAQLTQRDLMAIDVEIDTLIAVRAAFIRLQRLEGERAVFEAVTESAERIVEWVERLQDFGQLDIVALYLARAERDQAREALELARADATSARRDLLSTLGLLPTAPVEIQYGDAATLPELQEMQQDTLFRLPELRAAEAAYAASEAKLRLEISRQYPAISLGPVYEYDRVEHAIGLGLGVTIPLFDRNQGNIAAAAESRERARMRFSNTLLSASHAEAEARIRLDAAERILQVYRTGAMRQVQDAADALEVRLRAGQADVIEMLAAQRAIGEARARVLELEETVATARLRAAVAGGQALQEPPTDDEETDK